MRRSWAAPLLASLSLLVTAPGWAQVPLAGRWRVEVSQLTPQSLSGELQVRDSSGRLVGTLFLSNHDGPPAVLRNLVQAGDGSFRFELGDAGAPLRFSGRSERQRLTGQVEGDGGTGRWTAERLDPGIAFYPVLPRFRMSQLVGGSGSQASVIPGRLVAAGLDAGARGGLGRAYRQAADAAGVVPLDSAALIERSAHRVMGTWDRPAMMAAVERALAAMRARLPDDGDRKNFDRVFRPRGTWLPDMHAAALDIARRRSPRLEWATVVPALHASGWLADTSGESQWAVPGAIQRLRLLARQDSVAAQALLQRARATAPAATEALTSLLRGYGEAEAWHREAIGVLLTTAWVAGPDGPRSPAAIALAAWTAIKPDDAARARPVPLIRSTLFGQPQAIPQSGVPVARVPAVVAPVNWSGEEWLRRNGARTLIGIVRELELAGSGVLVERGGEIMRVLSVPQRARESDMSFLAPEDAIVIDPGYVPVLALGAVLHEWGHLLVDGWRMERAIAGRNAREIVLAEVSPWLNEGLAEAWTDRVLAPIAEVEPLAGFSEAEKRARLALTEPGDPHIAGYLLVRHIQASPRGARAGAPEVLRRLVEREVPELVLADPVLGAAFPAPAARKDLRLPVESRRFLVPETVFTIEDLTADAVTTTIRNGSPR